MGTAGGSPGDLVIPKYLLVLVGLGGTALGAIGGVVSAWTTVSNTIVELKLEISALQAADVASIKQREQLDTRQREISSSLVERMQQMNRELSDRLSDADREIGEIRVEMRYINRYPGGSAPDFAPPPPNQSRGPR